MSSGEEIQSGLIIVDGVSKLSVMDGITNYLAGEWTFLSKNNPERAEKYPNRNWSVSEINIRNTCARSFGPYGYVVVAFDYTKSSVMDEIEQGEQLLQAYANEQQVPHFEQDSTPDILGGAWYVQNGCNVRVKVLPALEGMRYDIDKDRGHVVVQISVPDNNLDLVGWCASLKEFGIDVLQHEGALHADAINYRHAFRLAFPKNQSEEEILETVKSITKSKYDEDTVSEFDIRTVSPRHAELFTSAVNAYGTSQNVADEEYTYVYAQTQDRQGLLGDIANFFVTSGCEENQSRSVVRSSCRALLGYTSVLLCLKGVKDEDSLFSSNNEVNLEFELGGTPVLAEFASRCDLGPWSASSRSTAVRFKASHPDERGLMRNSLATIQDAIQRRIGQYVDVDISEYDAWSSLAKEERPAKTTVACCVRVSQCDLKESRDIRNRILKTLTESGWVFEDPSWKPTILI